MDEVKLKVNLPVVKLELTGDPEKHLPELRKFFAELRKLSNTALESELLDDLPSFGLPFWQLSREVQKNEKMMNALNQLCQVEPGTLIRKISIENISEVTEEGSVTKINVPAIKESLKMLCQDVESEKVSAAFVHVLGKVSEEQYKIIVDQVMKHYPHARLESMKTPKEVMGKTLVECMFFGNFPEEE